MDSMKVVVSELPNCRRGLEVEVPVERVAEELGRAYRDYSQHARVPGFRRGRIPLDVVRRRFAKEVRDEVVGRMVREYAYRALEEQRLQPVRAPVLDDVSFESGRPLKFRATFEIRPRVTVTGHREMAVEVKRQVVTDEMVESALRDIAERAAKLEEVAGRPVQKGDFAVGTLSCRFITGKGKNLTDESLFLEAGSDQNHPDFNAAILGLNAGETRSFETAYPEDASAESLRGCTVAYTIALRAIKRKVVPPIDDDLAREIGGLKTLAELRDRVRAEIERRAAEAERTEAGNKILAALVAAHPMEVPESLVEAQMDSRLEAMAREMMARGIDPTRAQVDWSAERERLRPGAADAVRAMLILEAIASQETIEATEEEINEHLRDEARRRRTTVNALKERLAENAGLEGLRRQIVREKSLDFLLHGAIITHEVR